MDGGEEYFLATGAVHLLADDLFDAALHAAAERHVGVDTGHELIDEAAADEELVRDGVGVCGGLAEGVAELA